MKKIKNEKSLGLVTEVLLEEKKRTRFWFWAFVVAITAFIVSCIRATIQK